jgi:hypothetical protein
MKAVKYYYFFSLFLLLPILLLHTTGCQKEYSFEGLDSAALIKDSIPHPPPGPVGFGFPLCSLCKVNEPLQEGSWNFKTTNSYLCGSTTDGIITSDKNAFTFFGPSACSLDSGMVITAYIDPFKLVGDVHNITTNKVAFYYYDHNATSYILISQTGVNFSLTVDSYIETTGIATGTFNGGTFRANGEFIFVKEGRFKVKLRK